MPQFEDLARPILMAIARASGDRYEHVTGNDVLDDLRARARRRIPSPSETHSRTCDTIATSPGRVGWAPASADVKALVQAFEERAADPAVPEAERDALKTASRDLPVDVLGSVITSWLRSIGIG
jgi:hypothetical protein